MRSFHAVIVVVALVLVVWLPKSDAGHKFRSTTVTRGSDGSYSKVSTRSRSRAPQPAGSVKWKWSTRTK